MAALTEIGAYENEELGIKALIEFTDHIRVQLIDMDAERVVGTKLFPLDLRDAAIAYAKRLVK